MQWRQRLISVWLRLTALHEAFATYFALTTAAEPSYCTT